MIAQGKMVIPSFISLFDDAILQGELKSTANSYHFYGSQIPGTKRTRLGFGVSARLENNTSNYRRTSIESSVFSTNVMDSTAKIQETCLNLCFLSTTQIWSVPFQITGNVISASNGLGMLNLAGGIDDYKLADVTMSCNLQFYWARGMAGQDLLELRPNISAAYKIKPNHQIRASYTPTILPMSLSSAIEINQFLSTESNIRHTNIEHACQLSFVSDLTDKIRSRLAFQIQLFRDFSFFTDTSRMGIWTLASGGHTRIKIIHAEMFAKLASNDYFSTSILLRSTKDANWRSDIPYLPTVEAKCRAHHQIGSTIDVGVDLQFVGDRIAEPSGSSSVSEYTVVNLEGEYRFCNQNKLIIGVRNLLNSRYEIWRGYQEYPRTIFSAIHVQW